MNKTMLPTIASHCPAGTSTYTVLQYAQEIKHSEFGKIFADFYFLQCEEHCWCWCWCSWSCWCWFSYSERFAGLDWGNDEKNIAHHGTPEPPVYNLRDVNTKVKICQKEIFWTLILIFKTISTHKKNPPDCSFLGKQRLALRRKRPHEDCWQCKQPWSWIMMVFKRGTTKSLTLIRAIVLVAPTPNHPGQSLEF